MLDVQAAKETVGLKALLRSENEQVANGQAGGGSWASKRFCI